jgi:hypothetical protein
VKVAGDGVSIATIGVAEVIARFTGRDVVLEKFELEVANDAWMGWVPALWSGAWHAGTVPLAMITDEQRGVAGFVEAS